MKISDALGGYIRQNFPILDEGSTITTRSQAWGEDVSIQVAAFIANRDRIRQEIYELQQVADWQDGVIDQIADGHRDVYVDKERGVRLMPPIKGRVK